MIEVVFANSIIIVITVDAVTCGHKHVSVSANNSSTHFNTLLLPLLSFIPRRIKDTLNLLYFLCLPTTCVFTVPKRIGCFGKAWMFCNIAESLPGIRWCNAV